MSVKKIISIFLLSICRVFSANAQSLPDFTVLVEKLVPTVVSITTEVDAKDEIVDNKSLSSGSGFIISSDGFIVTNKHVINDANKIIVSTYNGDTYEASIVGVDSKTDLAVLKIMAKGEWESVFLGDSDNIKVGEWVIAIGNPFGLGNSVTKGIISAKSRDIDSGNYDNFIQTDASINRGNSGGPLFDMDGKVIGINTAIFSTTGSNMGINFAIPINLAKWVIKELKEKGEVKRGWIGIKIKPNITYKEGNIKIIENKGALIASIAEKSPAQKADLQPGDIILSIDDYEIDNTKNLSRIIAEKPISSSTQVRINREGRVFVKDVKIEEMPEEKNVPEETFENKYFEETLIPELSLYITKNHNNFTVSSINPDSDAAKKGLVPGNIITKIDNRNIFSIDDINNSINEATLENRKSIKMSIKDGDKTYTLVVELIDG